MTGYAGTVRCTTSTSGIYIRELTFNLEGIDDLLSKHVSHLFIRDPLVVFSETIDLDDTTSTDHFEVCAPPSIQY